MTALYCPGASVVKPSPYVVTVGGGHSGTEKLSTAKRLHEVEAVNVKI